jgi:hypothetical protein
VAIMQRSLTVHLTGDKNPEHQLHAETEHLPAGYVVRVYVNGVHPYMNVPWYRADLHYEFISTSSNTTAADAWYALGGDAV